MEITSRIQTAIFIKDEIRGIYVVAGTPGQIAQHHLEWMVTMPLPRFSR
jgi:hypothetical protein